MVISIILKVFTATVLLVIFLRWIWSRRRLYLLSTQLPGPSTLPFIGIGYKLLCKRADIQPRLVQIWRDFAHNPVFGLWLGPKFLVVVTGADLVAKVVTCPALQAKDDAMRDAMDAWIGGGQLTGIGPAWRARRRIIVPTLGRNTIEKFAPIFSRETAKVADRINGTAARVDVDLEHHLHSCILDIVCQTVLGTRLPARNLECPEEDFVHRLCEGYEMIMESIAKPWLMNPFLSRITGHHFEIDRGSKYFRNFIKNMIVQKQTEISDQKSTQMLDSNKSEDPNSEFRPLIEEILRADDIGMSLEDLVDETFTIFLASSDPTNNTACFILLMLAMHPDIQEKVVKEIYDVLGREPRNVTFEDCLKLNYIDMCLKETIRLFQTGPYSLRKATDDVKLNDKMNLPKGITVLINYFWLHRSPQHWKRPNEFYPDHFLPEAIEERHPSAYMPFSGGSRSCIGKLFAVVAIKIVVVNFLWRYRLSVKSHISVAELRLRCDISIVSGDGYKVCLEKRI